MQVNLYEFKTSLVFLASSGPAQASEILFETFGRKEKGKGGMEGARRLIGQAWRDTATS